jgi:hypothetical protein
MEVGAGPIQLVDWSHPFPGREPWLSTWGIEPGNPALFKSGVRSSRNYCIYFMQNWFNLSDPTAEDALYDSESVRRFAGIELVEDAVPDESTILRFRHLLERHHLTETIFAEVR